MSAYLKLGNIRVTTGRSQRTLDWCWTHGLPVRVNYVDDWQGERECEDAPYTDTSCRVGRVRLVAEEKTE